MASPVLNELRVFGKTFHFVEPFRPVDVVAFLAKVNTDGDGGCWLWLGCKNQKGYGTRNWKGASISAHRFAWLLFNGPIATGNHVHHVCACRSCVNPEHLQSIAPREHLLEHSPGSLTADKTHCDLGHELTGLNVYQFPNSTKRRCLTCYREKRRVKYAIDHPPVIEAARTHCKNGHEFTEENTYHFWGAKMCRKCHADLTLRQYYEKRDASLAYNCGHPQEPENTYTDKMKRDYCRECFFSQRVNRKKEFCVNGHARTEENLYIHKHGSGKPVSVCKICRDVSLKKAYEKRKAKYVNV